MMTWRYGDRALEGGHSPLSVADPDLELRGRGGGLDLLAMVAIFPSVISSFFTQNKGGGGVRPPGLLP